jgi:hypothetical protein
MNKKLLATTIIFSLIVFQPMSSSISAQNPSDGASCSKINLKKNFKQVRYICKKSGKKLVWVGNSSDMIAKADAEAKSKADAEAKSKADAEAKSKADAEAKSKAEEQAKADYLRQLYVKIDEPRESNYASLRDYVNARNKWFGWSFTPNLPFARYTEWPASVNITFDLPQTSDISEETNSKYQIKCINANFISTRPWSLIPAEISCQSLGNNKYKLHIGNMTQNVGYFFELFWELIDGSKGPTRSFYVIPTLPGHPAGCSQISCLVLSYE